MDKDETTLTIYVCNDTQGYSIQSKGNDLITARAKILKTACRVFSHSRCSWVGGPPLWLCWLQLKKTAAQEHLEGHLCISLIGEITQEFNIEPGTLVCLA